MNSACWNKFEVWRIIGNAKRCIPRYQRLRAGVNWCPKAQMISKHVKRTERSWTKPNEARDKDKGFHAVKEKEPSKQSACISCRQHCEREEKCLYFEANSKSSEAARKTLQSKLWGHLPKTIQVYSILQEEKLWRLSLHNFQSHLGT